MSTNDGGPAFPVPDGEAANLGYHGMSLRDWFATFAPEPSSEEVAREFERDRMRNPYNYSDKPRLRERDEIVASLRYRHADAMLAHRTADKETD